MRLLSFHLRQISVLLFNFFIPIALIMPTCGCPVQWPISHTNPAELMATTPTSHVIATCIFLYRFLAFRAWFSVGSYPSYIFWFWCKFTFPLYSCITVAWNVGLLAAQHAELHSTFAINSRLEYGIRLFKTIFAIFLWTPFNFRV